MSVLSVQRINLFVSVLTRPRALNVINNHKFNKNILFTSYIFKNILLGFCFYFCGVGDARVKVLIDDLTKTICLLT